MSRALLAIPFALAMIAAFAFASYPAAAQAADVPTHAIGDAVGFGASLDLGELAAPSLDQLRAMDEMNDNFTINEIDLTGSADLWTVMKVVGRTDTVYTIQEDSAIGVDLTFVADVTSNQFPKANTYPGSEGPGGLCYPSTTVPYEERTASVHLEYDYLVTASGPSEWNVSDFALRESSTTYAVDLRSAYSVRGFPSFEFNETTCDITISYVDRDVTVTEDIDSEIRVTYSPSYDFFDFPIQDGETWWASASSLVGGSIRGTIDVGGLDPEEEQQFFDSLNAAFPAEVSVTGLDGFPIVLEDVTITAGTVDYLKNGNIHDFTVRVGSVQHARESQMTLADGEVYRVYYISMGTPPELGLPVCSSVYSPDHGFVVAFVCEAAPGLPIFELKNEDPTEAEQKIDETKANYGASAVVGNPLGDLFLKPPFLGFLLIAAVAILVAALLVRRRRKPAMAPPPTTPSQETTTPGVPPPPGQP